MKCNGRIRSVAIVHFQRLSFVAGRECARPSGAALSWTSISLRLRICSFKAAILSCRRTVPAQGQCASQTNAREQRILKRALVQISVGVETWRLQLIQV